MENNIAGLILVTIAVAVIIAASIWSYRTDMNRSNSCAESCYPTVSKIIDYSCFCASDEGWALKEL